MRTIRQYLPAAVILVGVLLAWEVLVGASGVQGFVLPRPSAIWAALVENWTADYAILPAARVTLFEALGGLAIGTLLGVTTAFVVSLFPASRDTVLPLAIAINAIPIIAFAPIANNWLGITSPLSKMAVAAALVYFPIMINVLRGLTQVEGSALELMRSYAAGPAAGHHPAARPECAPLLPDRAEDRDHPQPHRRGGGRVLRRPQRHAGPRGGLGRQLAALRRDLGSDPGRLAGRHRPVPAGGRPGTAC